MINEELIELQKGCKATCVVVLNEDTNELDKKIIIDSNSSDSELLAILKDNISKQEELDYFVITEIDKLDANIQNKYYQIVKDREFFGIQLPKNMVIVLTVKEKEGLKNISRELYNLCVVAF